MSSFITAGDTVYLWDELVPYLQCETCLNLFAYVCQLIVPFEVVLGTCVSSSIFFSSIINLYPVNMPLPLHLNAVLIVYEYSIY